jgi:hypothetical protein
VYQWLGAIEAQWFGIHLELLAAGTREIPLLCMNYKQSTHHRPLINQSSCTGQHVETKWSGTTRTRTRNPFILGRTSEPQISSWINWTTTVKVIIHEKSILPWFQCGTLIFLCQIFHMDNKCYSFILAFKCFLPLPNLWQFLFFLCQQDQPGIHQDGGEGHLSRSSNSDQLVESWRV